MKKNIVTFWFLFAACMLWGQTNDEKKYLLSTHSNTFGLYSVSLSDPYLSPLLYSGEGLSYSGEVSRFFKPENKRFSMTGKLNMTGSLLYNPTESSAMTYVAGNYGWGINYHININKHFRVLAGGLWDAEFGFKYMPRNINNPVNMDIATNLNVTGAAMYDVPFWKRTIRLRLAMQTPIAGYMFVPGIGASYYEMFSLGNLSDAFHFSSLRNKRGLKGRLTASVPFKTSTWQIGLDMQTLKYKANDLVFKRNECSVVIGTTFDVARFAGRKTKAPQNFISTNE